MKRLLKSLEGARSSFATRADASKADDTTPVDLARGLYLSGFARGGTTWARQVISSHPEVFEVPGQVVFTSRGKGAVTPAYMEAKLLAALSARQADVEAMSRATRFVTKAPPNSEVLDEMIRAVPQGRFLYIIRDPRDVLVSHQRTGSDWTDARRDYDMAATRTARFYEGYLRARDSEVLLTFRYEDLHQQFPSTFGRICRFAGIDDAAAMVESINTQVSFRARTGRAHEEQRGMYRRGVVGDWGAQLAYGDAFRFQNDDVWAPMLERHGYDWTLCTVSSLLRLARDSGVGPAELTGRGPGLALFWSLEDGDWSYPKEIALRIETAYQCAQAMGFAPISLLPGNLPEAAVATVRALLEGRPVALCIDADEAKEDGADSLRRRLEAPMSLLESLSPRASAPVLVRGDSSSAVTASVERLRQLGLQPVALRGNRDSWKAPLGLIQQDEFAVVTAVGMPPSFDFRAASPWATVHDMAVVLVANVARVGVDAPLSLGFREVFDDLRRL